jgi:two-component system CheB/CheR fusion protein
MPAAPPVNLLRVLVIDDSPDMCASTARLVNLWVHDARVATDGLAALEAAAQFNPDVILLDIAMPGMDGYEVARRLRQEPGPARPLLVSMSGFVGTEFRLRALESGCDLHWIKPVEPEILQRLLAARAKTRDDRAFVTDCVGT